jgi:hypothetical protein
MTTPDIDRLAAEVRERGYAVWPGFLTPEAALALRASAVRLLDGPHAKEHSTSTRVWDLYRHGPEFRDCLRRHEFLRLLRSLLGEHFQLSDFSLNSVPPGQAVGHWHMDYPYNDLIESITGPILSMQCILTLDDFTEGNGATHLVPGTHSPHRTPGTHYPAYDVFEAPIGSLLVMASATHHRAGANGSDRERIGALITFVPGWVRTMVDPPEEGPWSQSEAEKIMLGLVRPGTIRDEGKAEAAT